MLHGLVVTVVFFTDRLLLGRYSPSALATMGITGPVLWGVSSVFSVFTVGLLAMVGRHVGADRRDRARALMTRALGLAGLLGAAVGALGWLSADQVAAWLTDAERTSQGVRDGGAAYLRTCFPVFPLLFGAFAVASSLQGAGDTRTPMVAGIVGGVSNLAISWVLIFGHLGLPEWGVQGAAVGSAAAFTLESLVLLVAPLRRRAALRYGPAVARTPGDVAETLRVMLPTFGERALFHVGFFGYTALVGRLGDASMAAHQAIIAIESISFVAADSFGIAAGALAAQKLGAQRPDLAWWSARQSVTIATCVLLGTGALFAAFPEAWLQLFGPDDEVLRIAIPCLMVAALAQPLMGFYDAAAGVLRGAGDTRTPMWTALVGPLLIRVPVCWFLAYGLEWGLVGIWVGTNIDWVVRCLWIGHGFLRRRWLSITLAAT
jgi:putative MATE family efflux protein